jgi:hypothetical protein
MPLGMVATIPGNHRSASNHACPPWQPSSQTQPRATPSPQTVEMDILAKPDTTPTTQPLRPFSKHHHSFPLPPVIHTLSRGGQTTASPRHSHLLVAIGPQTSSRRFFV